jgi:acyl-coenzyme A synthetase/AMP-(fatty) acid ligase
VDEAIELSAHKPTSVMVFQRPQCRATLHNLASKNYNWTGLIEKVIREGKNTVACEEMKSSDVLYLLYTSGTTGKPKGTSFVPCVHSRNRSRVRWKCSPTCILDAVHLRRQTQ